MPGRDGATAARSVTLISVAAVGGFLVSLYAASGGEDSFGVASDSPRHAEAMSLAAALDVEVTGGAYRLTVGPCGGTAFAEPDAETLRAMQRCLQGRACPDRPRF